MRMLARCLLGRGWASPYRRSDRLRTLRFGLGVCLVVALLGAPSADARVRDSGLAFAFHLAAPASDATHSAGRLSVTAANQLAAQDVRLIQLATDVDLAYAAKLIREIQTTTSSTDRTNALAALNQVAPECVTLNAFGEPSGVDTKYCPTHVSLAPLKQRQTEAGAAVSRIIAILTTAKAGPETVIPNSFGYSLTVEGALNDDIGDAITAGLPHAGRLIQFELAITPKGFDPVPPGQSCGTLDTAQAGFANVTAHLMSCSAALTAIRSAVLNFSNDVPIFLVRGFTCGYTALPSREVWTCEGANGQSFSWD